MGARGFSQEPGLLGLGMTEAVVVAAAIPRIPVFVGFQAESAV